MKLEGLFRLYTDEYSDFDLIEEKFSNRPDLHAFILLDKLLPDTVDIVVSSGEDDIVFLNVNAEGLFRVATKENIRDLVRCGVCYDKFSTALYMMI